MAFNSIVVLLAAFLAVCSGRALTNDEFEFGVPLTGYGLQRGIYRTVHPFGQPLAVPVPVRDRDRPVVVPQQQGLSGLARSEVPATTGGRQYSSGVQVPIPVQVQSQQGIPVPVGVGVGVGQSDSGVVNSGYVFSNGQLPYSLYPYSGALGNIPVVNNNYGYNSGYGYIPYYYTYSAGYIPQAVPAVV